ncbi:C-type lectin domain family 4 member M-like [Labrus mixtus]|uniref:C-type lectin domain family 4 member M-like n=1 Tax=Labrus mixtus TaxID=508554 RepID=UPI0029C0AAD6|nr:C-type lectin domain family 4 member M-like [Labrus mixtus]
MEIDDNIPMKRNLTMEDLLTKGNVSTYHIFSHTMSADLMQPGYSTGADQLQGTSNALAAERKQFDAKLSNLTKEKDQLQTIYDDLKKNYDELQRGKDELQRSYTLLKSDKGQLQTNLTQSKYLLQSRYQSLSTDKEALQGRYNTLQREKEQLQTKEGETIPGFLQQSKDMLVRSIGDSKLLVGVNSFVNGLLGSDVQAWIGMTDNVTEGTWKWVDGTPVNTTYWRPAQPNSYGGNQDCGEMVQSSQLGGWNDERCSKTDVCICEK